MQVIYSCAPFIEDDLPFYDDGKSQTIDVHERDERPTFTGLYDLDGNRIMRMCQREPIGFRMR